MQSPEAYFDEIAPYYEAVNPIEHDVGFWVEEAQRANGPVLEVGCGTGRVYLELLDAGVDAHGIDISRGMLDELESAAADRGLDPTVERADMRTFDLDRSFDLVVVPLRTFMNAVTVDDQKRTLRRIREHLTDDGRLILDFPQLSPEPIAESYGVEREIPVEIDGEQYTQVTTTEFVDRVEEITRAERRVYDADGDLVAEGAQRSKLLHAREVELLLDATGYSGWTMYGGYDRSEPDPEAERQEIAVVAEA
ncbi:type 12 methyltransferase [Halosimplex carlsbadense 2-9-1]|uniref:Type 12 methyltransferase n=1 Tax=Halosimplex carlsbadense 2-9-1 TaxID=797114 RepID=M0CCC1_9EURY|nr:class I SAM-dependent methyltransferase [Halosimplex carlsbadense]ELZ20293.1 type 12 methyltransferase [Halosimplex carlsbadense 2-9-1]